ncbi:MAG: hypothetical protein ACTSWW_04340 [Promethearchaeota archaeon]
MQLAKLKKLVFPMMILGVIVASFGGFIPTQTISPNGFSQQPTIADVSGSYRRIGKMIYDQSLSGLNGLSIEGINSIDGETNVTDLLMAGTSGSGTWRGLLGYEAEYSNSLPILISENDDSVMDMVRYEDPDDHNVDIIFIERGSQNGRMVRQRGVDPTASGSVDAYPEVAVTFTGAPLVSMCLGYFADGDAEIDTAAISTTGKMVGMTTLSGGSGGQVFLDLGWTYNSDYRFTKNTIAAIDDLDGYNTDTQDLIMGHSYVIYAISGNYSQSNAIIWETDIGSSVGSVLPIPDISSDGFDDVVVVSRSGIHLLEGKNGSIIWSNTTLGSYFRDVQLFNDINSDGVREIITGDSDGNVYIIDVNPNSVEFGTVLSTTNIGYRYIGAILEIGDLNDNGKNEYAIGGDGVVGVLLDNGTKYWTGGAGWQADIFSGSFQVWDIALLDDRDNDGYKDFVAIGGIDGDGGISMYSAQGQLEFRPDLSAYSVSIDTNCSTVDHEFTYQISAVQVNNLTVEISLFLDGIEHEMVPQGTEIIWDEGVVFQYSTTLDGGTHEYYFVVTDTSGNELRTPLTGVYNGPTVGDECDNTEPTPGPLDGISAFPAAQLSVAFISIGIIVMVIKKKFR